MASLELAGEDADGVRPASLWKLFPPQTHAEDPICWGSRVQLGVGVRERTRNLQTSASTEPSSPNRSKCWRKVTVTGVYQGVCIPWRNTNICHQFGDPVRIIFTPQHPQLWPRSLKSPGKRCLSVVFWCESDSLQKNPELLRVFPGSLQSRLFPGREKVLPDSLVRSLLSKRCPSG